jgi:hypothetical protein
MSSSGTSPPLDVPRLSDKRITEIREDVQWSLTHPRSLAEEDIAKAAAELLEEVDRLRKKHQ